MNPFDHAKQRATMTNGQIVTTGTAGTAGSIGAWWISNLPAVNGTLQFLVLLSGLVVSALTIRKLSQKKKKKCDHEKTSPNP